MVSATMSLRAPIICTLILFYILIKYSREKHLEVRNSKKFGILLWVSTINLFFDIITELPNCGVYFSDIVNNVLQTISLLSLFFSCYYIYQYMLCYVELNKQQKLKENKINNAIIYIGVLWLLFAPLDVGTENGVSYLDGPKIYGFYLFVAYFIICEIIHLIADKKYIPKKQYDSIVFSVWIFITTAILQMVFPFLLISGIGLTLEILVLYLALENPERYINLETGAFNASGLFYVLKEKVFLKNNENLYLYAFDYSDTEKHINFLKDYIKTLQKNNHFSLYEINNNVFVIINKKNVLSEVLKSFNMKIIPIDNLDSIQQEINDFVDEILNKELYIDKMTNVFNRNKYELDIKERTQLDKTWYIIADINNLKLTNDTLGHDKGDELIKDFVYLLRTIFMDENIYRLGGDEFVILSSDKVFQKVNLLKQVVSEFNLEKNKNVSYAIGYEQYIPEQASWEYTTKKADEKMYENKKKVKEAIS